MTISSAGATPGPERREGRDPIAELRESEYIKHSSLRRVLRQVLHRVDETEGAAGIAGVEVVGDDYARPPAHARQDRDVLLAVGALVGDGLADDSGAALELPK